MENKTKLFIHPYVRRGLASYIDEVKDDKSNANLSVTLQLRAHKAYKLMPPEMPDKEEFKSISYKLVDIKKEDPKASDKKDSDKKDDKTQAKPSEKDGKSQTADQKTDSVNKPVDDGSKTSTVDPKKEPAKEEGKDQTEAKTEAAKTEDGKTETEKKDEKKKESEKDVLDELEQFLAEWQNDPAFADEQNVNISRAFTLAGPAEVKGINPSAIRRLFPAQGSAPLACTLIPYVEFYEDDLPWRFTPMKPEDGKLRPWLALVACKADEFSTEVYEGKTYLTLKGTKDAEGNTVCPLPDVEDIHLFAHAQMEKYIDKVDDKGEALVHASVSRVLCVSKLEKNTEYTAFLIPTFKLGMPNNAGAGSKDCAWSKESYAGPYPVYFQWSFKTGEADFRTLAELMHPMSDQQYAAISDKLDIDVCDTGVEYFHKELQDRYGQDFSPLAMIEQGKQTDPLFGVLPVAVALTKMASERGRNLVSPSTKALVLAQEAALKDLLKHNPVFAANKADLTGDSSFIEDEDPWVVPPVYGARHKLSTERSLDNERDVISQINLTLENRMAAGMGVTVVQQNQEDFVHRAWEQVEQVNAQNRIIKELSAMQSTNSIGQRRIMPYWKVGVDSALKAIKSDAALKVATRSRYVGSAAITQICKESSADAKATILAQVEAPVRPSGVYQEELEKITNPRFWDDAQGNKRKLSGCIPENKAAYKSETARWDLFKSFVPLKPYLSILSNLRTEEKKVNGVAKKVTSNEWLFVPKHELNTDWMLTLVKTYILDKGKGYWGYEPKFADWIIAPPKSSGSGYLEQLTQKVRSTKTTVSTLSLLGLADWLEKKSNSKSYQYALIEDWQDTDPTAPYCIALTGDEYEKVRAEIQKHKKDVTIGSDVLYLKVFTRTPKKDNAKEFDLEEHILPVVNADASAQVKFHLDTDVILKRNIGKKGDGGKDIVYTIDPTASGMSEQKPVSIKVGGVKLEYRWLDDNLITRTANYASLVYFQSVVLNSYSHFDIGQLVIVNGYVDQIVLDNHTSYSLPFVVEEKDLDKDNIIGTLRSICNTRIASLKKIEKYLLRPTYLTIPKDNIIPENEFAIMDFFNLDGEQTFEHLLESTISNIQKLKPQVDEFVKQAEAAKKEESKQKDAAAAKEAETEKQIAEEESKKDTFATDTNKKKLEAILAKYNDGQGRTAEELAQRLWEIANSRYPIMAYPEFYDPTFFYLRELDSRYILPAAGSLPQDSISVFISNPEFEESFLIGMNTEMGKELLWREYPTDERGSYFRKFWDKERLPDCVDDYFDINEMHKWNAPLGLNHRSMDSTLAVFVIHAKLMRAFPDTQVVITSRKKDGSYSFDDGECFYPEMTSWLDNETYIAGFPLSVINYVKASILGGKEYCLAFRENAQGLQFITKDIIKYEPPKEEQKTEEKKDEAKKEEASAGTQQLKTGSGETVKTDAVKPEEKKDETKPLTEEEKKKAEEQKKKEEEEAKKRVEEEKKKKEEEEKAKKKASDFDSSLFAGHRVKTYTVWGCDIKDLIQNI